MKARETMIAWCRGGPIAALPWPDRTGRSDAYTHTGGATDSWLDAAGPLLEASILLTWHHAVVRDLVPSRDAHAAFLLIDEYRAMMADDCLELT